ncbi:YIP1 family protein [Methanofollis sp. W23]|uniref:YIP1 family protein n=1 Tax=Methanofollis sp. W23 TaxID=2817849 RepID=UPI001AE6419D|nr:YIP1 family protein [Methanofollis sp. W23]
MNPVDTFQATKDDDLGEVITYFVVLLLINAVLSGLLMMVGVGAFADVPGMGAGIGVATVIVAIIAVIVAGIIGIFIAGLILHLFVLLLIGGNGVGQSIKAMAYGATPGMLLGWIPIVNLLAGLWSVVLYILGVRELHETTTGRAAAAVLLPVIIIFILGFVLLAAVVAYFSFAPVA